MRKKRKKILAALLAVSVMLTACGETETQSSESSSTEATDAEDTSQEAADAAPADMETAGEDDETQLQAETTSDAEEEPEAAEDETEDIAIDFDEEIRNHYIAQKEDEMQIQVLMLADLEKASYIELSDDSSDVNYRKMITDALVEDAIDDSILTEGAKSAIDALCEGKSTQEIIEESVSGLTAGVQDTITSNITEALEGDLAPILDCQLFDEVTWVSDFLNVDDTPIGLLNGMITCQKTDVESLLAIINRDDFQMGDLTYASGLYQRICERQDEIVSAGGTAQQIGRQEELDELIENWKSEKAAIYALSILQASDSSSDEPIEDIYSAFRSYEIPALFSRYDVAAYREQQKYTEQSGMVTGKLFGSLLGSMANEDLESNQKVAQENKISFYSKLEASLEDSYALVCAAKEGFDELYDAEYAAYETPLEEYSICTDDDMYAILTTYLDAMTKYTFDLKTAALFWSNTLSDKESAYVDTLNKQLQDNYAILNAGLDIGIAVSGYDIEEESARYINLMDQYIDFLNNSMIYSSYETTYSGVSNVTAYGVGNFNVYYKGTASIPIILAEEQLDTNWHQQRYLWIYDTEGNPIYIRNRYGTVYVKDGLVVDFVSSGSNDDVGIGDTLYNVAVRILQDLKSGALRNSYKNYAV